MHLLDFAVPVLLLFDNATNSRICVANDVSNVVLVATFARIVFDQMSQRTLEELEARLLLEPLYASRNARS